MNIYVYFGIGKNVEFLDNKRFQFYSAWNQPHLPWCGVKIGVFECLRP